MECTCFEVTTCVYCISVVQKYFLPIIIVHTCSFMLEVCLMNQTAPLQSKHTQCSSLAMACTRANSSGSWKTGKEIRALHKFAQHFLLCKLASNPCISHFEICWDKSGYCLHGREPGNEGISTQESSLSWPAWQTDHAWFSLSHTMPAHSAAGALSGEREVTSWWPGTRATSVVLPPMPPSQHYEHPRHKYLML